MGVTVPTGLLAEIAADLKAGGERAARWRPAGARVFPLLPVGDEASTVRISMDGHAWALVGSADDPDSPRPAVGDRVLASPFSERATHPPIVTTCVGDEGYHGIVVEEDGKRVLVTEWAILPARWPADSDDDEFEVSAEEMRARWAAAEPVDLMPAGPDYHPASPWPDADLRERVALALSAASDGGQREDYAHVRGWWLRAADAALAASGLAEMATERARAVVEVERVLQAAATTAHAVTETLGAALRYPRDADGPVVGDLVPEVVAEQAAERIRRLTEEGEALREVVREAAALQEKGRDRRDRDREEIERLRAGFRRITAWLDENQVDGMASVDEIIAEALAPARLTESTQ